MSTILASTSERQVSAQVHSYVERRAPDLHNAWANTSLTVYDHDSGQYISDVQVCTDRFKKVLALYTQKTSDSSVKKFDITECHTWDGVQEAAARAVAAYNAKETGFKGFLRKVGRKFGKASPAHQGWIQTLPGGDYTSIICGALTLIFGAAARMSEVRKKILEALDCIPDALDIPERYLNMYQNDQNLARKAEELYMALLEAIEAMLDWLDHKAYKEVAKVFAIQAQYGVPIERKLDAVQVRSAAFVRQVELCLNVRVAETNYLARVNEVRGGVMLESIEATKEYAKENSNKLENLTEATKDNAECLNSLTFMLKEQVSDLIKYAEWYALKITQEMASKLVIQAIPPPMITVDQLLPLLCVPVSFASRDAELSIRGGNQLKPSEQQRAEWLMTNDKFQSWFTSGRSDMLVIDGMGDMTPISPMSYFCSLLSQQLSSIQNAVPLTYFCGINRAGDEMGDATAIMRSLISQLLTNPHTYPTFDLRFISFDAMMGVKDLRLDFLCELFRRLIGSLSPNTAVFILIDGMSWFENEPRRNNLWFVMQNLRDLVSECNTVGANGGCILKLLVTSPKMSMHVKHVFPRDKHLILPNENMLGNGQRFNVRQMAMQQQRLLGSASSASSQESGRLSWMSSSNDGTPSRPGVLVGQNYDYFRRSSGSLNSPGQGP